MNPISCIVVDDEPLAVQLMESYVKKTPFLELKGSFSSATNAFASLQENPADLVFCDIQMPGLNGMEFSRMLPKGTRIIFTTAFPNYAVEGFKVSALDYLLKPISYADFLASAQKAQEYFRMQSAANGSGSTASAEDAASDGKKEIRSIFVKTEYRLQQIELDRILFIEGLKDYVKIHVEGESETVLSLMRMKTLEEQLPSDRFVRVQKSYIVQISRIKAIERNHLIIDKFRIPIGDAYQAALYSKLAATSLLPK